MVAELFLEVVVMWVILEAASYKFQLYLKEGKWVLKILGESVLQWLAGNYWGCWLGWEWKGHPAASPKKPLSTNKQQLWTEFSWLSLLVWLSQDGLWRRKKSLFHYSELQITAKQVIFRPLGCAWSTQPNHLGSFLKRFHPDPSAHEAFLHSWLPAWK